MALHNGFYDRAVEWADEALGKAAKEEDPSVSTNEIGPYREAAVKKVRAHARKGRHSENTRRVLREYTRNLAVNRALQYRGNL